MSFDVAPVGAALLAALPVAALFWVRRGQPEPAPPLRFGRWFLFYALLFAAYLLLAARIAPAAALFAAGLVVGWLGAGRGLGRLYLLLYGADWVERHPDAARRDALRWQLVMLIAAVLLFVAAILVAMTGLGRG